MKKTLATALTTMFLLTGAQVANAESRLPECIEGVEAIESQPCTTVYEDGIDWDKITTEDTDPIDTESEDWEYEEGLVDWDEEAFVEGDDTSDTDPIDILSEDWSGYVEEEPVVEVATEVQVPTVVEFVAPVQVQVQAPADLEAQAWALWDAVGAEKLLPTDRETRVEFTGYNRTGFPYLQANMITVWDDRGNHYLFTF